MKHIILTACVLLSVGCTSNKGTTTGNPVVSEDSSASGAAAQAVGGALSSSSASGTLNFQKPEPSRSLSAGTCPDYTTTGADCSTDTPSHTMWLRYQSCTFATSETTWHGTQAIIGSSGTPACGSFPSPGANGTLYRQFVSAPGSVTPYSMVITSRYATVGGVDNHTADLGNFDNQTLATLVNGGYGAKVQFGAGGERTALTIAQRIIVVGSYDHSIYGNLTIGETAGNHTRTVNGSIDVYHNHVKVVGTSTFTNVVHTDTCCLPISGTIQTLFNQGQNVAPTSGLGAAMVGKTETLTFTGCGTADLTNYDGTTQSVALSRCY
jgi:hypothetical protein